MKYLATIATLTTIGLTIAGTIHRHLNAIEEQLDIAMRARMELAGTDEIQVDGIRILAGDKADDAEVEAFRQYLNDMPDAEGHDE